MTNTALEQNIASHSNLRQTPTLQLIDISRGALHFGIRSEAVLIDQELVDQYKEVDVTLGQNLIGSILSVLSYHLAAVSSGVPHDHICISAVRREDALVVDVDLEIRRSRGSGGERLVLRKVAEHESEFQFA